MYLNENYMKENILGYAHGKTVNIDIVSDLQNRTINNTDFTVVNALFGSVKLTKNTDTSKYGICFDSGGTFTSGKINNGRNVIIFGVDTKNSTHSTNKTQNIYVLGKDFLQGINGTTIYAEKIYKTNFTQSNKKFVLSFHYNDCNSYLFVTGSQELQFKSTISYLDRNLLRLAIFHQIGHKQIQQKYS